MRQPLCVRAIKKDIFGECLRDLNALYYTNTNLLSFCSTMFLKLSMYCSVSKKIRFTSIQSNHSNRSIKPDERQ